LPALWARVRMSSICGAWMCMPLTNTASDQEKSSSVAREMFSSTKRMSQLSGR
jgi:hypothetical protein